MFHTYFIFTVPIYALLVELTIVVTEHFLEGEKFYAYLDDLMISAISCELSDWVMPSAPPLNF